MDYISIALLVLSLILMLWIIYLKYKSKYTREKYAFASLFALTSLATLGVSSVGYQTPWAVIIKVIAHFSGVEIETVKPEWSEKVLIIGFLIWVTWLIQKTFADWDGEISLNQHEQKKRHDNVHFLSEGFKELQRKCSNQPELALYNAPDYSKQVSALAVPKNNLAWHIQAIELLTLRWQNYYRFETNNDLDWHEKAHCWLGKNVKEDKTTAVFCCRQIPDDEQIKAFVDYVNALQHITTLCEFIIIVQNGEGEEQRTLSNEITLQQYTESYLLDSLVNFEDYFLDLKKRVESDCLPDSELVLPDIYVPSTIKNENKQPIEDDLEIYLSKWLNESGQRQLALLGEYGQGKSTGTLMFSHHLVTQHNGKPPRIPILLELRGKSPKTLQPLELLSVWAGHYRIDPKALMKLQQAGRLLLIFEGFDEMAEVADGEARFDHFRSLWKFCYPKAKILITGRPNFFLDNQELKALLGVDGSTATGAYVQALHLQPFSLTQIAQSLDKLGSPNRDDICQLAQEDAKFYDVISRPSMLYLVNQIWASELKQRKHEINSALVIGQFIKHNYKRQTEKSHDDVSFMILNESERDYFMTGIAVYMAQERLPNQINGEQFNKIVDQLYETIPDEVSLQGNALTSKKEKPLRRRLQDHKTPLDAVKHDVRTCGVLVNDSTRNNTLKFPHKSFLEYLLAYYVVKRLVDKNNAGMAAIWNVTHAELLLLHEMLESLEFAGELLRYEDTIKNLYNDKKALQQELYNLVKNRSSAVKFILKKFKLESFFNWLKIMDDIGGVEVVVVVVVVGVVLGVIGVGGVGVGVGVVGVGVGVVVGVVVVVVVVVGGVGGGVVVVEFFQAKLSTNNSSYLFILFLLMLGLKQKEIKEIYGKYMANKVIPRLLKGSNAEYFLEKYDYYETRQ